MGREGISPAFLTSLCCGNDLRSFQPIVPVKASLQGQGTTTALHLRYREEEGFIIQDHGDKRRPRTSHRDKIRPSSKKKLASSCFALILSAALLLGNFDFLDLSDNNASIIRGTASATDSTMTSSQIEGQNSFSQTSVWPPTSDQDLFRQPKSSSDTSSGSIQSTKRRYWDIMSNGNVDEIITANERLIDHAVATINTMYYDSSGGFAFDPKTFYDKWKDFRYLARHGRDGNDREMKNFPFEYENAFSTRENAVKSLKWLVSTINDPYSKYLTREELKQELLGGDDGFLGLGALVDVPTRDDDELMKLSRSETTLDWNSLLTLDKIANRNRNGQWEGVSVDDLIAVLAKREVATTNQLKFKSKEVLSVGQALNLPIVKAIVPDSPAERAGLVVGDRIASVGTYQFLGMSRPQVRKALDVKFHAENYFGRADLTIAKPIVAAERWDWNAESQDKYVFADGWYYPNTYRMKASRTTRPERVMAYKLSHVKSIPTTLTAGQLKLDVLGYLAPDRTDKLQYPVSSLGVPTSGDEFTADTKSSSDQERLFPAVIGGDSIVHYATLTSHDSIFQKEGSRPVGYIRLTRFSSSATAGYINAINSLEAAGVDSYIIDLRNNYGGVIQEAMLTASTLLRDPHSVLCYTLNSRGGFRPQENMEYIIDKNYPGYFLSAEPRTASLDQVKREHPEYLEDGWSSPTSYASLRELKQTRGIKPARSFSFTSGQISAELKEDLKTEDAYVEGVKEMKHIDLEKLAYILNQNSQKKLVILINEGTASAAEVFASALHDNGRTVALIGTKTFGKGLIQHTFPMPDGGGLRLTVAEYLTPALSHVTKVGEARFDSGIHPDIRCESKQGIPKNIGADLCVGVALDVLGS
ncbi:hypothetical protein HJC23_010974 [Cyclotella cryptica]|uniref:Tail specific protease domain-containing protein n=1 Tax=Cyclotella cryptica TaxID=29204 RepID=A0ABD3PZW3_9STRA|eukprot:CCRYP_010263-RA/>CCRYP_010263-RA protein AED:0.08 eAED:-0.10 QI:0/0/0/1/1/1/2/0/869